MKTTAGLALLASVLAITVTCVHSHSVKTPWPGFDVSQWKGISYYLKRLPQKQFFGMQFVLNVTGERCTPQWHLPKPPCWNPGWPWPWFPNPGHGSTTRRTGQSTTTSTGGRTSTTRGTSIAGVSSTSTGTSTSTRTSTSTGTSTPSTSTAGPTLSVTTAAGQVTTSTCPYTPDLQDFNFCRHIQYAQQAWGPLAVCRKYFNNETFQAYLSDCMAFQCKYQRAYRCYGELPFVENCSKFLTGDESLWGWRWENACPQNSTPFPAITFTDLPWTGPTTQPSVAKRSVRRRRRSNRNQNDNGENDQQNEDNDEEGNDGDEEAVAEGTSKVAFGIKNNWCVPKIFSYWWRKRGGHLPGKSSENNDSSDSDSHNGGGGKGGKDSSEEHSHGHGRGNGKGGKNHGSGKGGKNNNSGSGKNNNGGSGKNNNSGSGHGKNNNNGWNSNGNQNGGRGSNSGSSINKNNWQQIWQTGQDSEEFGGDAASGPGKSRY